jgi:hypothetical protein
MDDAPGAIPVFIAVVVLAALSAVGIIAIFTDNRHFGDIESQCKQQGYIQNKTTRIMCKVEEKNGG